MRIKKRRKNREKTKKIRKEKHKRRKHNSPKAAEELKKVETSIFVNKEEKNKNIIERPTKKKKKIGETKLKQKKGAEKTISFRFILSSHVKSQFIDRVSI